MLAASFLLFSFSCKTGEQWAGQGEIKKVVTQTVPVIKQFKGVFEIADGIYFSNDFPGGRINGATMLDDGLVGLIISPENTPINPSPWYAFKVWSHSPKEVKIKLFYPDGVNHRYYPAMSKDGVNWAKMDSTKVRLVDENSDFVGTAKNAFLSMSISKDTTWIAAQQIVTEFQVDLWSKQLEVKPFVQKRVIGKSHQNRPIKVLKVGESNDKKMVVVLSRQHPPEVTGYLAMQAFVEAIADDTETAKKFRSQYNTYIIALANPDGAANGHWRHNNGGIDLNRDWEDFNQPETSAIRNFFEKKIKESDGKIYFFVDFHSTWQDIYYTIAPELKGNMPGLVPELIRLTGMELEDYDPNIRPSPGTGKRITSASYFFHNYGAESLTYEIGDNTPPEFIKLKGEITATKLMELMTVGSN